MQPIHIAKSEIVHNKTLPLKKGRSISTKPRVFRYRYSTAPTSNALEGVTYHHATVGGLNEMDADCTLSKRVRKTGRYLHAILDREELQ